VTSHCFRFKTSNLEHIIEVRLYDEIDFVCPHFHTTTDPSAYEYYIIHMVSLVVTIHQLHHRAMI